MTIDKESIPIDILNETVRLLLSETRGGVKNGRIQVTNVNSHLHSSLTDLASDGRLETLAQTVLNVALYPQTAEEIPAYRSLQKKFEQGMVISYENGTLTLEYEMSDGDSEIR